MDIDWRYTLQNSIKEKKLGSVSVSAMSGTEEKLNFIDMKSASKEKFQCTDKVLNGGMKENGSHRKWHC